MHEGGVCLEPEGLGKKGVRAWSADGIEAVATAWALPLEASGKDTMAK